MKEAKLVPVLRFPGFKDNWKNELLNDLGYTIGGGTPKSSNSDYWKGDIPWLSSSDIKEDSILEYNISRYITEEAVNKSATKKVPKNSILIVSRVGVGKFAVAKQELCTSQDFTNFVTQSNPFFLAYYFRARDNKFKSLSQGTSIKGFTGSDLKNLKFSIPHPEEQEKIATFLTAIDKRIKLLTDKKEELEQYKKGLMQKIFDRDVRFRDENGEVFPEWQILKSKEVFHSHSNKNHNGELPILSASQQHGMIYRNESGLRIQSSAKSVKSYKIVEPGDFVISLRSFQGGIDYSDKKGICSPAYTVLKNSLPINNDFFRFYFKKADFIERLSKTVVGIRDGKQITYDAFGTLKIPYPSVPEQQKVASFLSSIDSAIENISNQIDTSTEFKKGLLQKMFV